MCACSEPRPRRDDLSFRAQGGAVYVYNGASLSITDSSLISNSASLAVRVFRAAPTPR